MWGRIVIQSKMVGFLVSCVKEKEKEKELHVSRNKYCIPMWML